MLAVFNYMLWIEIALCHFVIYKLFIQIIGIAVNMLHCRVMLSHLIK